MIRAKSRLVTEAMVYMSKHFFGRFLDRFEPGVGEEDIMQTPPEGYRLPTIDEGEFKQALESPEVQDQLTQAKKLEESGEFPPQEYHG